MSRNQRANARIQSRLVEVKSKFYAEFRRFSLDVERPTKFENFYELVEQVHRLKDIPFIVTYTDPEGDLLPINNDDNYAKAVTTAKPLLKLVVQRQGEGYVDVNGYGTLKRKGKQQQEAPRTTISLPHDFRKVSAIIDVDIIPETHRRVKLMKNGSDKPLGFYIRDGTSVRTTHHGMEKIPGIFISRLVPGGLAESTGLLAVNDEVLEVNGIEVSGKTLDQVTDMMVANSANLIITVKPASQKYNLTMRGSSTRGSQKSSTSLQSAQSVQSLDSDEIRVHNDDDEDEVKDHLTENTSNHANTNTNTTTNSNSRASSATSRSSGRASKSPPKDSSATPTTFNDARPQDINKAEVTL